jgi:hypothetical protein
MPPDRHSRPGQRLTKIHVPTPDIARAEAVAAARIKPWMLKNVHEKCPGRACLEHRQGNRWPPPDSCGPASLRLRNRNHGWVYGGLRSRPVPGTIAPKLTSLGFEPKFHLITCIKPRAKHAVAGATSQALSCFSSSRPTAGNPNHPLCGCSLIPRIQSRAQHGIRGATLKARTCLCVLGLRSSFEGALISADHLGRGSMRRCASAHETEGALG